MPSLWHNPKDRTDFEENKQQKSLVLYILSGFAQFMMETQHFFNIVKWRIAIVVNWKLYDTWMRWPYKNTVFQLKVKHSWKKF